MANCGNVSLTKQKTQPARAYVVLKKHCQRTVRLMCLEYCSPDVILYGGFEVDLKELLKTLQVVGIMYKTSSCENFVFFALHMQRGQEKIWKYFAM